MPDDPKGTSAASLPLDASPERVREVASALELLAALSFKPETSYRCEAGLAVTLNAAAALLRHFAGLEAARTGPHTVVVVPSQRKHPMFHGDTDAPGGFAVTGPIECAQIFGTRRLAERVAEALNMEWNYA